jgi:hypothetical protein
MSCSHCACVECVERRMPIEDSAYIDGVIAAGDLASLADRWARRWSVTERTRVFTGFIDGLVLDLPDGMIMAYSAALAKETKRREERYR